MEKSAESKFDDAKVVAEQAIEDAEKLFPLEGNRWIENGKKGEVTLHYMESEKVPIGRGEGIIPYPMAKVADYLHDRMNQKEHDENCESVSCIKELDGGKYKITHYTSKSHLLVDARETINIATRRENPNGSITIAARSCDVDVPPRKKIVRARLIISGWKLSPDPVKPEYTRAIHIGQVDPMGDLPIAPLASSMKQAGNKINVLTTAMKKKFS